MRRIIASLNAVLMLAAVTAVAQEKMKDPPKVGHEGKAKAGGAKSAAAVIAKATSAAPPDIGRNAAVMGMGADGKMKELRAGTNGWTCMLDLAGDSMCLDDQAMRLNQFGSGREAGGERPRQHQGQGPQQHHG